MILCASDALADGWSVNEIVDDEIVVADVRVRRAGVTAIGPGGAAACGSAAAIGESPFPRAWFELLERVSIMTAGDRDVRRDPGVSRSNGVALAADLSTACERARRELAERDRILRSWRGEMAAEPIVLPLSAMPPLSGYTWRAARIPPVGAWSADLEVAAVVALPRDDARPLLRGFGAAPDLDDATRHAVAECVQALAFLGPEDIPVDEPSPSPTPIFHLDLFLWPGTHAILRGWIDGALPARSSTSHIERAPVTYLDVTPHWAQHRFRVARAMSTAALPLAFGRVCERDGLAHPIP